MGRQHKFYEYNGPDIKVLLESWLRNTNIMSASNHILSVMYSLTFRPMFTNVSPASNYVSLGLISPSSGRNGILIRSRCGAPHPTEVLVVTNPSIEFITFIIWLRGWRNNLYNLSHLSGSFNILSGFTEGNARYLVLLWIVLNRCCTKWLLVLLRVWILHRSLRAFPTFKSQ